MKRIVTDNQDLLGNWLCSRTGGVYTGGGSYIGLIDENNTIIAVAGYEDYNGASVRAHIAFEGRLTKEFIWFGFWYPFEQLKVKKIIGLVSSNNEKALKLDKHFGYIEEAIIKDAAPDGDLHILTMTREQCKILDKFRPKASSNLDDGTFNQKDDHHGRQILSTSST